MQLLINRFKNTQIATKFSIIFILLGIGFIFMGTAYYKTIKSQQISLKKAAELKYFGDLVDKIQLTILEANRYVNDFETTKQLDDVSLFNGKMAEVDKRFSEIKTLMRSEKDKQFISTVENTIDKYQDDFYAAAEVTMEVGLTEQSGLLGEFNKTVAEISALVIKTNDEKVLEKFFSLRNAQVSYLKDNNIATPGQVLLAQDNFSEKVSNSAGDVENIAELKLKTNALTQTFELLNSSFEEEKQLFKQIEEQRLNLQPLLKQLLTIKSQYEQQDKQVDAQIDRQIFTLFLASIALVMMTFAITVWVLKRSVLLPIAITQRTIQEVSAGNSKARSGLEQRDELGLLATALDTLLDEKVLTLMEKQAENEQMNDSIIAVIESVFKISQRDLTVLVPVAEDITGALADSINLLTESVKHVLFNVQGVSIRVSEASNQVQSQSDTVQKLADQDQLEIQQTLSELNSAVQTMQRIAELAKLSSSASLKAMDRSVTAQKTGC